MPAKSQAQQRYFAMCEHNPQHARGKCPHLGAKEMHAFSSTKTKNLPERVKKRK